MEKFVNVEETIYTHEYLWRSSNALFLQAELNSNNPDYFLIPSLLMSYLAFEAFVNFCGEILAPELWKDEKKNFQGKGIDEKIKVIFKNVPSLDWNKKDEMLYQQIKNIESFRHMVSHGKLVLTKYEATQKNNGAHFEFSHPWDKYITISAVKLSRKNFLDFSESILIEARKSSDEPHFLFPAYQGRLASATSSEISKAI